MNDRNWIDNLNPAQKAKICYKLERMARNFYRTPAKLNYFRFETPTTTAILTDLHDILSVIESSGAAVFDRPKEGS